MRKILSWWVVLFAAAILPATRALAAHDGDSHVFSTFLSAEADFISHKPGEDDSRVDAVADVVFSSHAGRWRFFGEVVLARDEHEIERAQVGYEVADNTVAWLGRFHQPSSVWNVLFHHGQFLQTSITRPSMEQWEDEQGLLPQHIVGGMIESLIPTTGRDGWRITAAAGLSPRIDAGELEPFVPFRDKGADLSHASLRLEWLPDALGENVIGMVASSTRMRREPASSTAQAGLRPVTVRTAGLFANVGGSRLRALANLSLLDMRGDDAAAAPLRFRTHVASYVQLESELRTGITLFARQEMLSNLRDAAYLALLRPPAARRSVAGVRAQLGLRNAISVEFSRSRIPTPETLHEVRLQWSAAFP